ncbi:MAG: hypothetical protein NVS4B7_19030 [Ktedonobacteraceae bacterium]
MNEQSRHPFKWRHFQAEIILLCVRWYGGRPSHRGTRRLPHKSKDMGHEGVWIVW